jgi:hypothetical protein
MYLLYTSLPLSVTSGFVLQLQKNLSFSATVRHIPKLSQVRCCHLTKNQINDKRDIIVRQRKDKGTAQIN